MNQPVAPVILSGGAGKLVTFGVQPAFPETDYGYIRAGAPTGLGRGSRAVDGYVEKTDAARAGARGSDAEAGAQTKEAG